MHRRHMNFRLPEADAENQAIPEQAFAPYPIFLQATLSWHQIWWQQLIYQRAWAAISAPRPVRVRVAQLPKTLRN